MPEVFSQSPDPEQIVFGNYFSFIDDESQEDTIKAFFEERVASINAGAKTWLPRAFDADSGVCADLFIDGRLVATLDYDYDTASVYATSEGGIFGDTTLCDHVSFAEAVAKADRFAE